MSVHTCKSFPRVIVLLNKKKRKKKNTNFPIIKTKKSKNKSNLIVGCLFTVTRFFDLWFDFFQCKFRCQLFLISN